MPKIIGRRPNGAVMYAGKFDTFQKKPVSRIIFKDVPKSNSDAVPQERVDLRGAQSRALRKSAKPTLPKTPWD